jgi:hypothetical protein
MNRADVTELHYITATANVTSILQHGILSHTLAVELTHDFVAMPEIQAIRQNKQIAIPPLGCGNGQLEWKTVGPLIYRYANQMDIPTELYAPFGTPPKELTLDFLSQSHTAPSQRKTVQSAVNPVLGWDS